MTPQQFINKWKPATLTEMSTYQQHFLDLCELLGEKKPAEVDPTGAWFTFQKGLTTNQDKKGFADVWRLLRLGVQGLRWSCLGLAVHGRCATNAGEGKRWAWTSSL
jgi:hypothetical protein